MKKWFVLLGGFLIHFCLGIPYLFGNLVTYISSYMHHRGFYKKDNIGDEQWIISPFMTALIIAMTITRSIIKRLGVRLALFMATAVFTGGHFLTYLAVQHSIWSTVVTYGAICGLGAGVSYVTTIELASQWFPSNITTATSMVTAGFSFGGLVFNYMVSFYVNPENLSPDIQLGSLSLFNQTSVVEKVPSIFSLLGITIFILQLIGIGLSFSPPDSSYEEFGNESDQVDDNDPPPKTSNKTISAAQRSFTPYEVLKDPGAYLQWLSMLCLSMSFMEIGFLYKNFGQMFIFDDRFLSSVGAVTAMSTSIYRIFISILADRFSTKIAYIASVGVAALLFFSFYQTKYLGKYWFFFWVCSMTCTASAVIMFQVYVVRYVYGPEYFTTNFSIINSSVAVANFVCPLFVGFLLKYIGWQNVILTLGAIHTVGVILVFFMRIPYFPNTNKSEKEPINDVR